MKPPAPSRPIHNCLHPRKTVKSRLAPYTDELLKMDADNKTLAEICAWLKARKVTCSLSNVQQFLASRRGQRKRESTLGHLVRGVETGQEVQHLLVENPTPKIETIIRLFRMLSVQLSAEGAADPKLLQLANQLARTTFNFVSDQTRVGFAERKLVMAEQKHAEWIKCEQTRALQLCLKEAKKFPLVARAFRNAFNALKATQTPALRQVETPPSYDRPKLQAANTANLTN